MKWITCCRESVYGFAAVLLSVFFLVPSGFGQTGDVRSALIPDTAQVCTGDTVSVLIQIDMTGVDAPDHQLGSFTGTVSWDSTQLIYQGNTGMGSGFTGNMNLLDSGQVLFNGANPSGAEGVIDVTSFRFAVADTGRIFIDLKYSAMAAAQTFHSLLGILTVHDTTLTSLPSVILTLGADPEEGGGTEPEAGAHAFPEGTEVPLSAIPAEGYYFVSWTGDVAEPNTAETTVLLDEDKTVTAHFEAFRTLTIEVLPDAEHGTTDPEPGTHQYEQNAEVLVTAIANHRPFGALFQEWQGDASGADTTAAVVMDRDKTITAVFYLPASVDDAVHHLPDQLALYQNYPNPFNPETHIQYDLPAEMTVQLEIFNIQGRLVRTLFQGIQPAGSYTEVWDAARDDGTAVTSGVYLLRLRTAQSTLIRRMFLLR